MEVSFPFHTFSTFICPTPSKLQSSTYSKLYCCKSLKCSWNILNTLGVYSLDALVTKLLYSKLFIGVVFVGWKYVSRTACLLLSTIRRVESQHKHIKIKNNYRKTITYLLLNILVLERTYWVCTPWMLRSLNYCTQNYQRVSVPRMEVGFPFRTFSAFIRRTPLKLWS